MKLCPCAGHEGILGGGGAGGTAPLTLTSILEEAVCCPRSFTHTEEPPLPRGSALVRGGKSVAPRGIRTPISQSSGAWPSHHTGYSLRSISNYVLLTHTKTKAGHARYMQGPYM
jgi:hypothetical protein